MPPTPTPADLAPRLLRWFRRAKRDLPWRQTRDPYHIWVAETMLQQTQVDRVAPYYQRFVAAFPTIRDLAGAPLDDVLRLWAGLGYYSRARNLHAACRLLVADNAGRFPESYDEAIALPGIGPYTAGAILSIALGQRHPAVDANARRVLGRVLHRRAERASVARRRIEPFAAAAVPERRPGDHNQALMELGSLVCLPRRPRCEACCLADICRAHHLGRAHVSTPTRRPRTRLHRAALALVQRRGRLLIAQRPTDGVWGGLWEFPNCDLGPDDDPTEALSGVLSQDFGLDASLGPPLGSLTYGIMSRRVRLSVHAGRAPSGHAKARRHLRSRWVTPRQLPRYALPAPHSRAAAMFSAARA